MTDLPRDDDQDVPQDARREHTVAADSLDALVAAPDHHRVILENESVRVLDTSIPPGDTTPLHTHAWPSVLHILSWSSFVRRDEKGKVLLDSRTMPELSTSPGTIWSGPLGPHTLENVGTTTLHVIAIEIKQPHGE